MEANRVTRITRSKAIRLLEKIRNSAAIQENYQTIINRIEKDDEDRAQIEFSKISEILYDSFCNISNFIQSDKKYIWFRHQDIREYFASFHVVWYLKSISTVPLLPELIPNFNLRTSVQKLILEALYFKEFLHGDDEETKKKNAIIKKENDQKYRELFPTSSAVLPSTDIEEVQSQICQNICLCYAAFSFSDHFMLHAFDKRHSIIASFCEGLISCRRFLNDYPNIISDTLRQHLLEVYTAVIQYYRMKGRYSDCRKVYEFCTDIAHDCDRYYVRMLKHQRGKALLYNSQDIINNSKKESDYYPESEKSAVDIFNEGIEELKNCMPYNMSANLLGHLYSTPVDWITENKLLERDVCTAFEIYRDAYEDMIDPY